MIDFKTMCEVTTEAEEDEQATEAADTSWHRTRKGQQRLVAMVMELEQFN